MPCAALRCGNTLYMWQWCCVELSLNSVHLHSIWTLLTSAPLTQSGWELSVIHCRTVVRLWGSQASHGGGGGGVDRNDPNRFARGGNLVEGQRHG